jgi:predicted component of type VI protein secretion system
VLHSLHDQIAKKRDLLADQVRSYEMSLSSHEPGALDRAFFLHQVNEAYATLGVLIGANGIHPFVIYSELIRIMGALSIFLPERTCDEIKLYDHTDLATIFRWVRDEIVRRLECLQILHYETADFIGTSAGMEARLRQNWLLDNWKWYVGAQSDEVDADRLIKILSSQEYIFVLASPSTVRGAFQKAAQGLSFKPLTQVGAPLPVTQRWVYFEVSKSGPVWSSVKSELTLALEFQRSVIANLDKLTGSYTIEFKSRGATFNVRMRLFAVPTS